MSANNENRILTKEEEIEKQRLHELGVMPIGKLLFKMSVPMMISMLMLACYNIVDSIFVARVSEDALSAISLAYPVQMLMVALNIGTNVGVTALISRSLGEKEYEKANQYARQGLFLAMVYSIICAIVGVLFTETYFRFISNGNESIIKEGTDYLSVILIISFGAFIGTTFEKMMQATGKSIGSMTTQLVGAVANIILDPIMIFGYFGCPAMGTKGAAVATVIGQILGAIVGAILNHIINIDIKLNITNFKVRVEHILNIYRVALPSIVMQAIGSFMNFGLNTILISYESAVAVLGVYYKIQSFIFMPLFGLNNGMVPIVSYNFGAHRKDRIIKVLEIALGSGFVIMGLGALIFELFPDKIFMLFVANDNMMKTGCLAFRIIAPHFLFANITILLGSVMQATKREIYSLIPAITRQLVVLLPVAYYLSKICGAVGVWVAFPFAEIFSTCITIFLFVKTYKETISKL